MGAVMANGAARAHAQPLVLGPGLEQQVAAMVFPGDDPPELAGDVRVDGARIESTWIDVPLAGEGRRGLVRLLGRGEETSGWDAGETPSFSVWLVDGADDPVLREAARALSARIRARDPGDFMREHGTLVTGEAAPSSTLDLRALRGGSWVALLGGLVLLAGWAHRERAWASRADLGIALALFVASLALRWLLPPWAPMHANDHGIAEMRGLTGDPAGYEASLYGPAYLQLVRAVLAPFGRAPDGPFYVASLLGALAPVALFALGRALGPDRRAGAALAALALVVHPGHVRLSLSESPKPLAAVLWLLGAALAVWAFRAEVARRTRDLAFSLTAIAWALALELHVLTVLLPIAGAALVLVAVGDRARAPRWPVVLGGVIVVGVFACSHLVALAAARTAAEERDFEVATTIARSLGRDNVLFDPSITPWLTLPLVVVSAIALARAGRLRWVAGAAIAIAILMPPSILIAACRTDLLRYQSEAHLPLFLLLVGMPGASVRGVPIAAVAALGLVATAIPGLRDVAVPDAHAQAHTIAREMAPAPPTVIVVAPERMRDAPHALTQFPDYAIVAPTRVARAAPALQACRVWVGVSCWSYTHDEIEAGARGVEVEPGAPMRRECVELLGGPDAARAALSDLVAIDVPHRDGEFHVIPAASPRVGYAPCPAPR
ncbi:Hypothetical protein I5071_64740 [Sandaracinus amylolyticus]|nr:Hypothetical protein I5071_64740 [Sandaracinus amylolyticus]